MADKVARWLFFHTGSGWEWRRTDEHSNRDLAHSTRLFSTLLDCIADARLHGYMRQSDDDRQRHGSGS